MFDVEKEVPSLELCRKLKELGFPQEGGGWYWREGEVNSLLGLLIDKSDLGWTLLEYVDGMWMKSSYIYGDKLKKLIKAPTCRELGEWLDLVYQKYITSVVLTERLTYVPEEINPNYLAEDLIWLAENGYVRFENERT